MNDHYVHTPSNERPKIFGMTASPVWNVKNPRGAISYVISAHFVSSLVIGFLQRTRGKLASKGDSLPPERQRTGQALSEA